MKKKFNLNAAALLCTMAMTSFNVYSAQEVSNFNDLKSAIENGEDPVDIEDSGNNIKFESLIDYSNKDVTITGQENSSFTPSNTASETGAFQVKGTGSLTLKNVNFESFGETSDRGVGYVIFSQGDVNIGPGVEFGDSIKTTPFGTGSRINGTILMQTGGTLTLESSGTGDVIFDKQTNSTESTYDIMLSGGDLNVDIKGTGGKVEIGNGIGMGYSSATNVTINHSGANEFVLGGNNNNFTGKYTQDNAKGTTTFKGTKYFKGQSDIQAGTFNWEASDDTTRGALKFGENTSLTVGDGLASNKLTLTASKGDIIADTINMQVKKSAQLNLTGFTKTLNNQIKGEGTLNLTNDTITFNGDNSGLASGLTLQTDSSKLILSNMTDDKTTLTKIAQSVNGDTINNTIIELENYTGTDTEGLNVDGKAITELNFSGTNNYTLAEGKKLTVSAAADGAKAGVITNKSSAKTTINGNVSVEEAQGEKIPSLVNAASAELTISNGSLTNKGSVDNKGTLKADSVINDGTFTSTGSGSFSAQSLINESGTFDMTGSTGAFTVSDVVQNSSGLISGQSAAFGRYSDITGSGTSLNLTGNLTITGAGDNAIQNSGEITAQNIDVQGGVQNDGNITASGTLTVQGKFSNSDGTVSAKGGSLQELDMTGGTLTNTGDLTIAGEVTGSGGAITHNSGNLTLTGDGSGFSGTFTQENGSTTVNGGGKLFNGKKEIKSGSLTVIGDKMSWSNAVELGAGTTFDFTGTEKSTISDTVLSFTATGANANFNGSGGYSLAESFNGAGNNLNFNNTTVTLDGTNYENSGKITLNNSKLDLHDTSGAEYKDYTFGEFVAGNNSSVDLDLQIVNEDKKLNEGYLKSDTLTFNSGSGTLSVGKLYIDNEAQNGVESYTTKDHVIKGAGNVTFNGGSVADGNITWSSSSFVYDVTASGKDITLSNGRAATATALNDMNVLEGERQFMAENEYKIENDLDETESGKFNVFGKNKDKTKDSLNGNNHRFFNIEDGKNTELHIDNLTITGASSSEGGSVLRNESADSKVFINDSVITGNSSTDSNGGAIYNNGGTGTNPKDPDSFTGLYVGNTTFENNTSAGKGGAIYNDEKGFLYLENVKTASAAGEGQNDIYNKGTAFTNGENTFNSLFTNEGEVTFQGTNTLTEFANSNGGNAYFNGEKAQIDKYTSTGGTTNFNSADAVLGTVTGDIDSSIINSGKLTLTGNGSGYTGNFSQTNGNLTVDTDSTFFSGKSTVSGGTLNWFTDKEPTSGTLAVSGSSTVLNVGDETGHIGEITFGTGSSISDEVTTNIYGGSTLSVEGGDVALSDGKWLGNVNLTDGSLTLNNLRNVSEEGTGTLSATGGKLTLDGATRLTLDGSSSIGKDVVTNITKDAAVSLKQGQLTLDSEDTWNGAVVLDETSKGTLTFDGYNTTTKGMGTLQADAGAIEIVNSSNITFGGEEEAGGIKKNVKTHIDESSSVTLLENGFLYLNDDNPDSADNWEGKVYLDGGEFYYGVQKPESVGELHATKGDLKLLDQSLLEIKEPSNVDDLVAVDIQQGATVDILENAKFNISGHDSETEKKDNWNGLVKNEGGEFTVSDMAHASGNGGGIQQTGGKSTFKDNSDIYISDKNSYITGGDVVIDGNSKLSFGAGIKDMNADNLSMTDNTQLGIMNGEINSAHAENVDVTGTANFTVDLNARNKTGDQFDFGSIKGTDATLNVSDFNFAGGAPIDRNIDFTLFTGDKTGVEFDSTKDLKFTPIGYYGIKSMGEGKYRAFLDHYNPQVFRGQVATIAMYTNQLLVDDIVTNHFILHNDRLLDNAKLANKYAAASALFNPYQKTYKEGGLWSKSYASFDKLDLTHGLSVKNNIYGMLLGADLPAIELKNGWEFIPTGYVGYNGGHQHFNGVSMYQNGGQLGAMGTFIKDKFIGSVTAYGGGYMNDMSVMGFEDNTANWFAGTAAKAAYNYTPFKDFTVQPNLLFAYNAFGKQNWGTDFGIMSMNSGMLNGINVAPGLNLILQKDTWSLYGSASYMYFANDKIDGQAGNVHLPNVRMDHGYIQYGIGGTKVWNDKLAAYGQVNIRNAGINGIGFQAGINYMFDLNETVGNIANGAKKAGQGIANGTKKTYIKIVRLFKK